METYVYNLCKLWMSVSECMPLAVSPVKARRGCQIPCTSDLELKVVVGRPVWVLGTTLGFSVKQYPFSTTKPSHHPARLCGDLSVFKRGAGGDQGASNLQSQETNQLKNGCECSCDYSCSTPQQSEFHCYYRKQVPIPACKCLIF